MRRLFIRVKDSEAAGYVKNVFNCKPKIYKNETQQPLISHYVDMPRFHQRKKRPYGLFKIETDETSKRLTELLKQKITDKTTSVWFPKKTRSLGQWAWLDKSFLKPKHPIFIISKNRQQCITARALTRMGVDFTIVVEKQEEKSYRDRWGGSVHAGEFKNHNNSSVPVRNYVDEISGSDTYWLMDDNIEDFNILTDNEKYVSRSAAMFRAAEDFCERFSNVGQAGFNYYSFAKKTECVPPYYLNTRIYSCTLMKRNLKNVRCNGFLWRGKWNEDTDLSLRILKAGYATILFNSFLAGKVTTQRMAGGNTDSVYSGGDNRERFADSIVKQHPDVAQKVWRFGRWHHKVNYKGFTQQLEYAGHEKIDYKLYLDKNGRGKGCK